VYVFYRNGVRYFQVNDLNGNVLGAFATQGHQFLVLPMGATSGVVNVLSNAATSANANSSTETIYSDKSITITATPAVSNNAAQPQTCDDLTCTVTAVQTASSSQPQHCDDLTCTVTAVQTTTPNQSQTCDDLTCTVTAVQTASSSQPQHCDDLTCTVTAVQTTTPSQSQTCDDLTCTVIAVAPTN
jgi:uncharacterized coiled-coil protein SlyX